MSVCVCVRVSWKHELSTPASHWLAACRKESWRTWLALFSLHPASTNAIPLPPPKSRLPFYRVWFASTLHEPQLDGGIALTLPGLPRPSFHDFSHGAPGGTCAWLPHVRSGMSNEVVVCIVEDLLFIFFSFRSFFARVIQTIWKCTCAENVSRWKSTVVWLILRCERSVFVGTIKRRKIMETMFRIEIEEKGILERKEERERERLIVWKFFKRKERLKFPINRTSFFFVRFKIVALLDAFRRCFNKINVYGWQWTGSGHED